MSAEARRTLDDVAAAADDDHGFEVPAGEGTLTQDGKRYRVEWFRGRVRFVALFRVRDCVAILQHVRRIRVSQSVGDRVRELDAAPALDVVPLPLLRELHADGFYPVEEVGNE